MIYGWPKRSLSNSQSNSPRRSPSPCAGHPPTSAMQPPLGNLAKLAYRRRRSVAQNRPRRTSNFLELPGNFFEYLNHEWRRRFFSKTVWFLPNMFSPLHTYLGLYILDAFMHACRKTFMKEGTLVARISMTTRVFIWKFFSSQHGLIKDHMLINFRGRTPGKMIFFWVLKEMYSFSIIFRETILLCIIFNRNL